MMLRAQQHATLAAAAFVEKNAPPIFFRPISLQSSHPEDTQFHTTLVYSTIDCGLTMKFLGFYTIQAYYVNVFCLWSANACHKRTAISYLSTEMIMRFTMEHSAVSDLHIECIWHAILPNVHSGSTLSCALIHVTVSSRPRSDTDSVRFGPSVRGVGHGQRADEYRHGVVLGRHRQLQMTTARTSRLPGREQRDRNVRWLRSVLPPW